MSSPHTTHLYAPDSGLAYSQTMTGGAHQDGELAPVVRSLALPCRREHAFTTFTDRIGEWWPKGFTASGDDLATVVIEGREGGRVYSRTSMTRSTTGAR
jgi:hypothetical protein